MNYRHGFHAGCFSDVFKHAVLIALLQQFKLKDAAFSYIDTHAGTGLYDLTGGMAKRSPEYKYGIQKVWELRNDPTSPLKTYFDIVNATQPTSELTHYPGSVLCAAALLRPQDDMMISELHSNDFLELKKNLPRGKKIHCHLRDAYEFLPAVLPPKTKRGLILIDPPFEKETEFKDLFNLLQNAIQKFPTGVYVVWYPIKASDHIKFIRQCTSHGFPKVCNAWFTVKDDISGKTGITGTGMLVINTPWKMDAAIKKITEYCFEKLRIPGEGKWEVQHS